MIPGKEHESQRTLSDKPSRLENRDTLRNSFCGRSSSRAFSRSRGFSARYDKRIASVSGATVRAAVERRRMACETTKMTTTTNHDSTEPCSKRETSRTSFLESRKYSRIYNGDCRTLSLRESVGVVNQ